MKSILTLINKNTIIRKDGEILYNGLTYFCEGNHSYVYELKIEAGKLFYKALKFYNGDNWNAITFATCFNETETYNFTRIDPYQKIRKSPL